MSRSDCRGQLESSFCKLDSLNDLPSLKKKTMSSHTSAPCLASSMGRGLGTKSSGKKKETALMSMLRADLQPKSDKKKSKHSSSTSPKNKTKKTRNSNSKQPPS
jgi:hypothetical protein